MSYASIRQAIIDKIEASADKIKVAYPTDRSVFEGFPAAVVSPSDNEADYGSTMKDRRVYVFKVRMYYQIPNQGDFEAAEGFLEAAVDQLIDIFNTRNVLGSACNWVEPIPSVWEFETRSDVPYRVATLTLRCIKYVAQ